MNGTAVNKRTQRYKRKKFESPLKSGFKRIIKNKMAVCGFIMVVFMILFSFIGPLFVKYGYNEMSDALKQAPSAKHLLGTDSLGRDMLARVMYGGRISICVGIASVAVQMLIGVTIGAFAGYYGGKTDSVLMAVTDIFLSIPTLPVILICASLMSSIKAGNTARILAIMFVMGFLSWPETARLIRSEILSLREQEFMQAAEALGLSDFRRIFVHLIPNVFPVIIVNITLGIGSAILTETSLSYLGVGVVEPIPSWGNLSTAANNISDFKKRIWLWLPPGVCILIVTLGINLLGEGLRKAMDPKHK